MCPRMPSPSLVWWALGHIPHEIRLSLLFQLKYDPKTNLISHDLTYGYISSFGSATGSVKRKKRCVKNSVNHWVLAWDGRTGHCFFIDINIASLHLVLNVSPFPVRAVKLTLTPQGHIGSTLFLKQIAKRSVKCETILKIS